ncbi:MAG: extracellular solute-binding protein [bacterium]|nr:extracellular solute-binding protein [bacterium]
MSSIRRRFPTLLMHLSTVAIWGGCARDDRPVVYCSVDETFGRMVLDRFEEQTGIAVEAVFDTEAGKTTGLVKRIRLEADRPRADVWFSGEVFQTILLAREGLLAEYDSPAAADVPDTFKDPRHRWIGIGLRGRTLAYDKQRTDPQALPVRWEQLADPAHVGRVAFANPLFGTTRGHVAAMFAGWGPDRGRAFLTALRDGGALMVDGNSAAVRAVLSRQADFGMTDTDDVRVARQRNPSLEQRFLDLGDGGTLLIPSTAAIIEGCRHPELACKLVDFLVSAEVERMLARSASGNIPVRKSLRQELGLTLPPSTALSYDAIADAMEPAAAAVREILIR